MAFRWISRSRLSMQRLGFCKAVLALSGQARTSGQMADLLRTKLEDEQLSVPYDKALADWLKGLRTNTELNHEISISLQKLYIYDHPSQTGWLSRLGFNEYVEYLPRGLHLVTASYEPADMGIVLSRLMSREQFEAFDRPSKTNPLILTPEEQVFFLYNLLVADGDFLLPLCDVLLNRFADARFSYLDVGSLIPEVMDNIASRFFGSAYTQTDRRQLQTLEKAKEQIIKNIEEKAEEQGSGSRREQTTIPRLEWLVDVGAIERVESRKWRFTKAGLKLAELTRAYITEIGKRYPENAMGALLDLWFFKFAAGAYGTKQLRNVDREHFICFIWPAYKQLAGVGGYCLFRPLLLYANIMSGSNHQGLFLEYEGATKLLEELYQLDPSALQYTIDRYNTDYQLRIERTPETSER